MNPYLCIDNERSSRAGSLGDAWSVDSNLPYNIYKGPHDLVDEMICLLKTDTTVEYVIYYSYLYTTMRNLLIYITLPLFSVGISLMICRPLPCEPLVEPTYKNRYV